MKEEWTNYLDKSGKELQTIQPKWAYGKDYRKARYTQDFLKAGCTIYHVKLSEVIKHTDFAEVQLDRLFTGGNKNDIRIAEIIHRWASNQFVDPPNIYVPVGSKTILFGDGRHRTKAAYFLGQNQIPIIIPNEDLFFINELLQLSIKPF